MNYSKIFLLKLAIFVWGNPLFSAGISEELPGNPSQEQILEAIFVQKLIGVQQKEEEGKFAEVLKIYYEYMKDKSMPKSYRAGCANRIGLFYMEGRPSIPQNYKKAMQFFKWAENNGDSQASDNITLLNYNNGCKLVQERSFEEAHEAFKQAEEKGHILATHNRNTLFVSGHGSLDQTKESVMTLLLETAAQGCDESILFLFLYQLGIEYAIDFEITPSLLKGIDIPAQLDRIFSSKDAQFLKGFVASGEKLTPKKMRKIESILSEKGFSIPNIDLCPSLKREI